MYRIYLINGHKCLESQPENLLATMAVFYLFYAAKVIGCCFSIIDIYGCRIVIGSDVVADSEIVVEKIIADE